MLILLMALQAQTVCRIEVNQVVCRQVAPVDYRAALDRGIASVPTTSIHQRIGRMIAAGDCSGAKATALRAGDIDLAASVAEVCR